MSAFLSRKILVVAAPAILAALGAVAYAMMPDHVVSFCSDYVESLD